LGEQIKHVAWDTIPSFADVAFPQQQMAKMIIRAANSFRLAQQLDD
jgi:hypothetical protein